MITIFYTLPLTITVEDKTVPYNGNEQKGYGASLNDHVTVTGLLEDDTVAELKYTQASGTLVGEYNGSFDGPVIKKGDTVVNYYVITPTPGKLTITDGTPDDPVDPSLVVTKKDTHNDDEEPYKYAEGETVTFNITVKNIYKEAKTINLSEIQGVTLTTSTFENVAAGETVSTTATYVITAADMAEGSFTNTVTASFSGSSKTWQATDDVTTKEAEPELTVTKEADKTEDAEVGDVINYTVTVENTGNVTVTGITLSDTLVTLTEPAFSLAPGAKKEITYTYTVVQADVDAGTIENTATATGKDPSDEEVTDSDDETVTTVEAAAELTVTKTANPTSNVAKDGVITYTVTVTNSGNVTVKDITLEDTLVTLPEDKAAIGTLAPGASKEITYTYTATQADVDAGQIDNTATATGKDPKNTDVSGTASAKVTTVESDAKLEITKTADPTSDVEKDDVITYTVTVKNTGNVTVKGITLEDEKMPTGSAPAAFDLAPGETKDDITYTYTVTQADVDAGEINNTVTATGKDPKDNEVRTSATAKVTTEEAAAELTVTKTADPTSGVAVDDEITYTVTVENTGNVTVKGITLEDAKMPATSAPETFDLAPGEKKEGITYAYTVTQADVDAGEVNNTVTATGKDPKNADVSDDASVTVTTVEQEAELTVTKTARLRQLSRKPS